ncbi:hypothetical protein RB598_000541 [Gaeumannomyces tritici]
MASRPGPAGSGEEYKLIGVIRAELSKERRWSDLSDGLNGWFLCASDIRRVWDKDNRLDLLCAAVAAPDQRHLTEDQLNHLRRHALPLLSFAVYIGAPIAWFFSDFPRLAFREGLPPRRLALPQPTAKLEELLTHMEVDRENFKLQYSFVPDTLKFASDAEARGGIPDTYTLPLETQQGEPLGYFTGSYANVYFCRANPEYVEAYLFDGRQAFKPAKPYAVAIKVLRQPENANIEVRNLVLLKKVVRNLGCHQSISLPLTIVKNFAHPSDDPRPLLIFPFADLGNLWQLLNDEKAVGDVNEKFQNLTCEQRFLELASLAQDARQVTDAMRADRYDKLASRMLDQCLCLSDALRFLHGPIAHKEKIYLFAHLDLKPDNIIISSHPGHPFGLWKLADFGISTLREHHINSGIAGDLYGSAGRGAIPTIATGAHRGSSTYQAPEVDLSYKYIPDAYVGRRSDIWSFGAILADVLAFAWGGTPEFQKLHDWRPDPLDEGSGSGIESFWERNLDRNPNGDVLPAVPNSPTTAGRGGGAFDQFKVRRNVARWLNRIEGKSEMHGRWVKCINKALEVNQDIRLSAKDLFPWVRGILYPPKPEISENEGSDSPDTTRHAKEDPPATSAGPRRESAVSVPPQSPSNRASGSEIDTPPSRRSTLTAPELPPRPGSGSVPAPLTAGSPRSSILTASDQEVLKSFSALGQGNLTTCDLGSRGMRILCVSMDQLRVVYLTEESIFILDIQPALESPLGGSPYLEKLPKTSELFERSWKGVAVGGDYIFVYGRERARKPRKLLGRSVPSSTLIRVLRLERNPGNETARWLPIRLDGSVTQALDKFDARRGVAVSKTGLIAVIGSDRESLLVLNASNPTPQIIKCTTNAQGFFSLLGLPKVARAVYKLDELSNAEFERGTVVLPHSHSLGCIVAKAKLGRLLTCPLVGGGGSRTSSLPSFPGRPRDFELRPLQLDDTHKLGAAVMHGSQLLLSVDKDRRLLEQRLVTKNAEGNRSNNNNNNARSSIANNSAPVVVELDPATKLSVSERFGRAPDSSSQLRAYVYNDDGARVALVLLCHDKGKVEVVRYSLPPKV